MAFVYRTQRKLDSFQQPIQLGPGSYQVDKKEGMHIPKAYVPFNSMQPRTKALKARDLVPGPGAYNVAKKNEQQKVVVENATEDIKILEITKPNAMFKSGTKRFNEVANTGPGPGEYHKEAQKRKARPEPTKESHKPRIIEHLIQINKYQSIPSIPSNIHAFGYYENEECLLQLNEPPLETKTGKKNDSVGPGQYNVALEAKPKGYSWKDDKTVKLPGFAGSPNIGPGAYDIRDGTPLYSYKPGVSFISGTQRDGEHKRIAPANKYTDRPKAFSQTRVMSEKAPASTHVDSSDDEYEYMEEATPGPGSYLHMDQEKQRRPTKSSHFGSTSKRFDDLPTIKQHIVGPGEYNVEFDRRAQSLQRRKVAPFNSKIQRFTQGQGGNVVIPGPGSYQPRNALEDQLIFKIQRGYRGQFGSTEQRFKDTRNAVQIGPGSYQVPASGVVESEAVTSGTSSFKDKVKKQIVVKNQNPPPGSYSIDYHDISKKVIRQEEDDPDLVIKKPGFNCGAQRFKKQVIKEDLFDDQDLLNEIHTKVQEEQRRNRTNIVPFNSNQPRMTKQRKEVPGPGEYDMDADAWNKRTYNILFADI